MSVALVALAAWCMSAAAQEPSPGALPGQAAHRTTLLVPLPVEPAWQDMAFLAAVPAACVANNGAPSLVALEAAGTLTPEIQDYLRRYRPDVVIRLGGAADGVAVAGRTCDVLQAGSADAAACQLSARFWGPCTTAVICPADDYAAGLVAAPLAARLRAPLLFATAQGLSQAAVEELRRLQARDLIVVGKLACDLKALQQVTAQVTALADATEVMSWVRQRGLTTSYLAALNPLDRSKTVIRKLSLAGALLAAGRDGLVVPLGGEVRWKIPFSGVEMTGEVPPDLPPSEAKPKTGRLAFDGREYAFILTGGAKGRGQRLHIDLDGDGKFTGKGDGPFATGDTVVLDRKAYAITLGTASGAGQADVRLSWPRAEQLAGDLRGYCATLGTPPEHLCLIGFPDAVPQAIIGRGGVVEEQTSDLPYANADDDPFAEIGVARVVAENASFATLFASRVLTYTSLLDAEWQDRACQARWESTYGKLFENVGFDASFRHTEEHLKWLEPPTQGQRGKRAQTFEQDSPVARSAILTHMDHSWWHELGHTFGWDAEVLLAPVVVESGGCLTAALDREPDFHSVVARLMRKGAVAFAGNSREGCAPQELQRLEFWNGMLSGQTIGQAHRRSINSALVTVLDRQEGPGGGYGYQLRIRTQFGDPAFAMRVPGPPRSPPARTTVAGNTVTVHAPAQWWPVKMVVPEDWKQWTGKDLYVLRGAGTYALREWCANQYDREETCMTAEFTTRRRVAKIEQIQPAPSPLGWSGSYHVDEHADGSRTYRWAVRLADFDQLKGRIVNAVGQLDYRMVYQ
ncbi:MAG: C25 family cysteine peptidase [Verrucomicrobia bacterium]|nr:C25 family cysteine peptidase [Verrucomicrobiota bacterium]